MHLGGVWHDIGGERTEGHIFKVTRPLHHITGFQ